VAAQTIFFSWDRFHASGANPSVHSVSTTANGFNKENVRDTSWLGAWKPADSTNDEYLQIDGGSAGWLGTTGGDIITVAIAYDARGCDQTTIKIATDAADAAGGAFVQLKGTFTLNTAGPTVDYITISLAASGKRYYRVYQYNADRGGLTKTVPIYAIAIFTAAEVHILDTEYLSDAPGPGDYTPGAIVGVGETAGGMWQTNLNGPAYQEFDVNLDRATSTLWNVLLYQWMTWSRGPSRAVWLQYEGIVNNALANFGMVYMTGFQTTRPLKDQYSTRLRFRTAGKPI